MVNHGEGAGPILVRESLGSMSPSMRRTWKWDQRVEVTVELGIPCLGAMV